MQKNRGQIDHTGSPIDVGGLRNPIWWSPRAFLMMSRPLESEAHSGSFA
jgi:hypothetical protein